MKESQPVAAYDVVVVGARCAGAAIARLLATAGLNVLMLDRTRLPADTVSTHAMMLGAIVQLRRWGLLDAVAATGATPIDGIDIKAGDVAFTARIKDIGGVERLYGPRRITLDAVLARAAVEAGAHLHTGVVVRDLLRDESGRVVGVSGTDADQRSFEVRARWVVGADGVRSAVARLVEAVAHRYDPPANTFHYAYWTGLDTHHYEFSFGPGAGIGVIPSDAGLTCVFGSAPVDQVVELRRDLDAALLRIVAACDPGLVDRLAAATRVSGYRGVRGLPSYLRQPWGPGWVLVGDAGYHRDAFSAHGITDAFRDAELAARAIHDVVVGGAEEGEAMGRYHAVRDEFAVPMYDLTARMASYDWDLKEILKIMSAFGDVGEAEARMLADLPELKSSKAQTAA